MTTAAAPTPSPATLIREDCTECGFPHWICRACESRVCGHVLDVVISGKEPA
jgi:hypothetical protein